jgi:hypothetical protein
MCTPFALNLRIDRHADAPVLSAVIDAVIIEATLTEEGQLMQHYRLKVRNTGRQYIRLRLPDESNVWSAMVGGRGVLWVGSLSSGWSGGCSVGVFVHDMA